MRLKDVMFQPVRWSLIGLCLIGLSGLVIAQPVNWQGPAGITIKDVKYPDRSASQTEPSMQILSAPAETTAAPYPEPPLAGFSPLIVIATSDEQGDASGFEYEHVL